MNSAMLSYDDFDLDTATADRYSLRDAMQKAEKVRHADPGSFVRVKSVEEDSFVVVTASPREVYDEWMSRIHHRWSRMIRNRASR